MKTNSIAILFLLLSVSNGLLANANETVRSVDPYAADFIKTARKLLHRLEGRPQTFSLESYREVLARLKVEATEDVLRVDGVEREAIALSDEQRVILNRGVWRSQQNERQKNWLVLQQMLKLIRVVDNDAEMSTAVIRDLFPEGKLAEPATSEGIPAAALDKTRVYAFVPGESLYWEVNALVPFRVYRAYSPIIDRFYDAIALPTFFNEEISDSLLALDSKMVQKGRELTADRDGEVQLSWFELGTGSVLPMESFHGDKDVPPARYERRDGRWFKTDDSRTSRIQAFENGIAYEWRRQRWQPLLKVVQRATPNRTSRESTFEPVPNKVYWQFFPVPKAWAFVVFRDGVDGMVPTVLARTSRLKADYFAGGESSDVGGHVLVPDPEDANYVTWQSAASVGTTRVVDARTEEVWRRGSADSQWRVETQPADFDRNSKTSGRTSAWQRRLPRPSVIPKRRFVDSEALTPLDRPGFSPFSPQCRCSGHDSNPNDESVMAPLDRPGNSPFSRRGEPCHCPNCVP